MSRKLRINNAFTLIELMVIVAILAVISVAIISIFTTTLKSSNKSVAISALKQKGNSVLVIMERMIREARNIEACNGAVAESIIVTDKNGLETTFLCDEDTVEIASNSSVLLSNVDDLDCSQFVTCTVGSAGAPSVTIKFIIGTGNPLFPDKYAETTFESTVSSRNY